MRAGRTYRSPDPILRARETPSPSLRPNGNCIFLAARIGLAMCGTITARAAAPLKIPFERSEGWMRA
jgi:hypothetical protein